MATLIGGDPADPVVLDEVDYEGGAQRPSETKTEYVIRFVNSRVMADWPMENKASCLVDLAVGTTDLAPAALAAMVRIGKLSRMDDEADKDVLARLASSAPQIGSLLQRPGLMRDLHAAEPYAVVSLVVSVLRATFTLPGVLAGNERHAQAYHHLQGTAGHCLELVTDDLQQPDRMPRSWQLMILSMIARLSATNAGSMPAGSDKQLAAVIAHCRSIINTQQTALDAGSYERALAYRALVDALLALGALHKAQPMTPLIAAAVLQAVQALIADAVQTGKPPDASCHMLYTVPLVEGALQNAPAESVESFLWCAVRALHDHMLPKPCSNPKEQVMKGLASVSQQLTLHVEEVARCLRPCVDSKLGSRSDSAGSNSSCLSILHEPPLQARWQAALAAALRTLLPWLEVPPPPNTGSTEDKLLTAATRLAALAAGSLQAAAESTDPAATLEQPPALALAEALMDYLDIPGERLMCALRRDTRKPGAGAYDITPFRAAAEALRALASTTAKTTAAADALGQVPPSDALLRCGCRAAVPVQLQLSMVEELFMLTHMDVGPNERHHVREAMLQAPALAMKLHDSGAAARSMLDRLGMAACLMTVIHRLTLPDTSHFGDFRAIKLPVLQAACKALAVLLAGSGAAKQQCLGHSKAGEPAWPDVADSVRQVLRTLPTRVRPLGEKALQQVEQALQGGPQVDTAGGAQGAAPVPQHSQADADLAMQMLLEEEEQTHSKVSKAAQKRARKKAAAAAAVAAAEGSQQQRPHGSPADTQDRSEPSVGAATAQLQQLHHDAPTAAAAGSATAAPSRCQPTHGWMLCPLTKVVLNDPVLCSDGHTYSRAAIKEWLDANGATSPLTGQPLASRGLIPNHTLRNMIQAKLQAGAS